MHVRKYVGILAAVCLWSGSLWAQSPMADPPGPVPKSAPAKTHSAAQPATTVKRAAVKSSRPASPRKTVAAQRTRQAKGKAKSSTLTHNPAQTPAVSDPKQQRLNTLMQQYKTDQISPKEYHQERAKLISQP